MMTSRIGQAWEIGLPLILVILALASYFNSLHVPFQYDDYVTIVEDPCVRLHSSITDIIIRNPFRPFLVFSFMLNDRLFGLDPFSFHLINLALHALNGVLFYFLLRRLLRFGAGHHRLAAFFAAALAISHPLMTEAVTYISSRSTIQAAAFLLLSLILYIDYCESGGILRLLGCFLFFVFSAGTKEIGGLAPLLWLAYAALYVGGSNRRAWIGLAPGLILFLAGGIHRVIVFFRLEYRSLPRSMQENFFTQLAAFPTYLRLFFFPRGQTISHEFPTFTAILSPAPLLGLILLTAAVAMIILEWRKRPVISFLLSFLLLMHLPSSGIFPLQEVMAEHRFYLPGFALCGLLALTALLPSRVASRTAVVLLIGSVCACVVLTQMRNRIWASEEFLWADAVSKQPGSARALSNYADVLRGKGEYTRSASYYAQALNASPDNLDYTVNLGICLARSGNLAEAEAVIKKARQIDPASPKPLVNLGNICAMRGDYQCARARYEEALAIAPDSYEARINLGYFYLNVLGDKPKAIALFEEAIRIDPVKGLNFPLDALRMSH